MTNPNQKLEDMNWFQKMELARALSLLPALPTMLMVRRKIGFRLLKPARLILLTAALIAVAAFFKVMAGPFNFLLPLYAIVALALGLFQRRQRWNSLCEGERWHTRSSGISYLEMLPLPEFILESRRLYRFAEPIILAIVAIFAFLLSHLLGIWLMFSALATCIYEQTLWEKTIEHDLDILDGLITSEVSAETSKHFENKPEGTQLPLEETAGIPVGLAPDIMAQIQKRRIKLETFPDNRIAA